MHLAICAIFRNEARYLREWLEFHLQVGVKRFHLYQNRSDDDYRSILDCYIDSGHVELIDWPRPPPSQIQAYQHFIDEHSGKPWWVAFIDCDEFLFSPSYTTVCEALEAVTGPDWGAVGINWMCFGASGQDQSATGLVIERFTWRPADNFSPNRHIKCVVRMDRAKTAGPTPHWFDVSGGIYSETASELAEPLSARPAHSHLRINHYHTKSRQEYLERIARGHADSERKRSPTEFDSYQAAEIDDRAIWRFLPGLKKRIEERQAAQVMSAPSVESHYVPYATRELRQPRQPPREFAAYRGFHNGETMLVCGCGSSLPQIIAPERLPTIGVNDVGRLFDPDYLVVTNPKNQFSGDRFEYVAHSRAKTIFTQLDLGIAHPNIVRFRLGRRGGTELTDSNCLPYTRNSPYVALCLALHFGATRIGIIGVDFTDHHFFASTGRHPLAFEVDQINNEYAALARTCRQRGVEVFNLSKDSRLTAFHKISPEQFARRALVSEDAAAAATGKRVFFVNYRFLSCGDVFSEGLRNAGDDLNLQTAGAYWDDAALSGKVADFAPDLLLVVHGRKYSQRRSSEIHRGWRSALWLLDEPYEVDDTSRFSKNFDTVFVNDPATLQHHKNSHFLPVCYDPSGYSYRPGPREHRVGFIGGANPARENLLQELARRNLLSYVVGGPWRSPELRQICLGPNIPASETSRLYQRTRIVVNVFRTVHHFNRAHVPAVSMNPRIYEAFACGALVVSGRRPEIQLLCPEMPVFDGLEELMSVIGHLLADADHFESVRKACIRRLAGHTYAHRLYSALLATPDVCAGPHWTASVITRLPIEAIDGPPLCRPHDSIPITLPGWEVSPGIAEKNGDTLILRARRPAAPGSEAGFMSTEAYTEVRMSFEVWPDACATLVAKVHQVERRNQASNSYHLMLTGVSGYFARHNHIVGHVTLKAGVWNTVTMTCAGGLTRASINEHLYCDMVDTLLPSGYCFLGVKTGEIRVRNVHLAVPTKAELAALPAVGETPPHQILYDSGSTVKPIVSIVTTVYDRLQCLDACLQSVRALTFDCYEHIIIADSPPAAVVSELLSLVQERHDGRHRLRLAVMLARANDWGITPAAAGLPLVKGRYVCFLSDDNGYRANHFEKLVSALDQDVNLGFAYSGCLYDGRLTLNTAPPAPSRIDLGQPLFRRELFDLHLGGTLPFKELAWDWKMIERLMRCGVRWKHIRDATFIFRLAKYPHLASIKNSDVVSSA
jgi:hypothetical protein